MFNHSSTHKTEGGSQLLQMILHTSCRTHRTKHTHRCNTNYVIFSKRSSVCMKHPLYTQQLLVVLITGRCAVLAFHTAVRNQELRCNSPHVLLLGHGNCHQGYSNVLQICMNYFFISYLFFENVCCSATFLINKLNSMIVYFTLNDNDTNNLLFPPVVKCKQWHDSRTCSLECKLYPLQYPFSLPFYVAIVKYY